MDDTYDKADTDNCMAKSFEIPKRLHATGTNRRDPPAIPEAPQAEIAETTLRMSAVAKSTESPKSLLQQALRH